MTTNENCKCLKRIILAISPLILGIVFFICFYSRIPCYQSCTGTALQKSILYGILLLCVPALLFCLIIKDLLFCLFDGMVKVRQDAKYAQKAFAIIFFIILCLYVLPVFFSCEGRIFFLSFSIPYMDYITVLTSILSLNSLFSYFFSKVADRSIKNRNGQSGDRTNGKVNGFQVIYNYLWASNKDYNPNFNFRLDAGKLYVRDYLNNYSGDNLWIPMNQWYEQTGIGRNYPLLNARANNWKGNEDWYRQLEAFADYLRGRGMLQESSGTGESEDK